MSSNCPPVKLPIHIEPSCGPKSCNNCNNSNCTTDCSIDTPFSSQNSYQNSCSNEVRQVPTLDIAYLSNVRSDCDPQLSITLNPITLSWCDFLILFYRANNVFSINPTNQNLCAISFSNQTFENTTSETLRLNLAQQIRIAWATKCETTIDNISPKINILLNKDTFGIRSLLNASSAISLTLDQAIQTLLTNGEIAPGDSTTSASVRFVVQYKYCFKPLNVCVVINFVYETNIPCYKNTNFCDDWCPPYSNDKNCRTCPQLSNETKDILKYLKKGDNESVTDSVTDDGSDINDMDSETLNNLKFVQKINDEATHISMESSKW